MTSRNRNFPFLVLFLMVTWHPVPGNGISISITNLHNDNGQVLISLFKDGDGYPDEPEKAIRKGKATIAANKAMISFAGLLPGKYAAVVLHDENNNLKMDKNWLGLPTEGYGFSNNVMGTFGPPGFSKASVSLAGDKQTAITIRVRY